MSFGTEGNWFSWFPIIGNRQHGFHRIPKSSQAGIPSPGSRPSHADDDTHIPNGGSGRVGAMMPASSWPIASSRSFAAAAADAGMNANAVRMVASAAGG